MTVPASLSLLLCPSAVRSRPCGGLKQAASVGLLGGDVTVLTALVCGTLLVAGSRPQAQVEDVKPTPGFSPSKAQPGQGPAVSTF